MTYSEIAKVYGDAIFFIKTTSIHNQRQKVTFYGFL